MCLGMATVFDGLHLLAMTVWRLWCIHTQTRPILPLSRGTRGRLSFTFVNVVLIESALAYSATVFLLAIAAFYGSNLYYCIVDILGVSLSLSECTAHFSL